MDGEARAVSTWVESKLLVEGLSRSRGLCENAAIDAVGGWHATGLFERFAHPRHPSGCGGYVGARRGAPAGDCRIDSDGLGWPLATNWQYRGDIAEGAPALAAGGTRGLAFAADRGPGGSHPGRDPRAVGRARG